MSASTRSSRKAVEVAAAHLDDRAEAAVEGAAARGLDDVDLPAEHRVAGEHARARGSAARSSPSSTDADRPRPGCGGTPSPSRNDSPATSTAAVAALERAQQLAERQLAFAADDEVDAERRVRPRLRRQARVVAADDDRGRRARATGSSAMMPARRARAGTSSPTGRRRRAACRAPAARPCAARDACTRMRSAIGDVVMRIDVAGERRERAVRHAHRDRRHVLERIRHREQQNPHCSRR